MHFENFCMLSFFVSTTRAAITTRTTTKTENKIKSLANGSMWFYSLVERQNQHLFVIIIITWLCLQCLQVCSYVTCCLVLWRRVDDLCSTICKQTFEQWNRKELVYKINNEKQMKWMNEMNENWRKKQSLPLPPQSQHALNPFM